MGSLALLLVFAAATYHLAADFVSGGPAVATYNVVNFGAIGDGRADDRLAFQKAWVASCHDSAGGTATVLVPSGKTFLLSPVYFEGPCKSFTVHFQVLGNIVAPNTKSRWTDCSAECWLGFSAVDNLIVDGTGTINGQGSIWWGSTDDSAKPALSDSSQCDTPTSLHFHKCTNLQLSGIHMKDSPKNHIGINFCTGVKISNIKITAPESSPNTDGIDISSSTRLIVQDSFIATGDDCIAINAGCNFINVTNVACGPGHGISVGSLGRDGVYDTVEEVYVVGCNFTGTENGARIKTFQGGSGNATYITFKNIMLHNVKNPIIIDQHYDPQPASDVARAVVISNVKFIGFKGTSASPVAITLNCDKIVGCKNIIMEHVHIHDQYKKAQVICNNAHGTETDTIPSVPCLSAPSPESY